MDSMSWIYSNNAPEHFHNGTDRAVMITCLKWILSDCSPIVIDWCSNVCLISNLNTWDSRTGSLLQAELWRAVPLIPVPVETYRQYSRVPWHSWEAQRSCEHDLRGARLGHVGNGVVYRCLQRNRSLDQFPEVLWPSWITTTGVIPTYLYWRHRVQPPQRPT